MLQIFLSFIFIVIYIIQAETSCLNSNDNAMINFVTIVLILEYKTQNKIHSEVNTNVIYDIMGLK